MAESQHEALGLPPRRYCDSDLTFVIEEAHALVRINKEKQMRLVMLIAALFVTTVAARQAHAYTYTINGASCVPGDPAIQNNRYLVTGGSVKHQSTATGLITLYCPIPYPDLLQNSSRISLVVTYADSDGTGTVANITAQLVKLSTSTGSLMNVGSALDSNSFGPTAGTTMSTSISHTVSGFDYYYVRIDINRSTTAQSATLFGVRVSGS